MILMIEKTHKAVIIGYLSQSNELIMAICTNV